MKPRVQLHEVNTQRQLSPVDRARQRHGKPFAHEAGSTYQPRATRLLSEWLAQRIAEKERA